MSYCGVEHVRLVSGLDSTDIRESKLRDLRDKVAVSRLNQDISVMVENERVQSLGDGKDNKVNGENTVFYLARTDNSRRSLGDLDNDGEVTTDDIEAYFYSSEEGERVDVDILSIIDADDGAFEAVRKSSGEPLDNGKLYVTYRASSVNVSNPHPLVETACAQLTSAYAFTNIEAKKLKNFSIGDVTIRKQSEGYSHMMDQYMDTVKKITERDRIETGDNRNPLENVIRKNSEGL